MLKKSDPHSSAKAVIGFLIVGLAFAMLFTFYKNKDNIINSGNFQSFFFLVLVGSCLLLTLLFLANKPLAGKTKSSKRRR